MGIMSYKNIHPNIHPSAYIAASADIIGAVTIGVEASVWPQVVIRGDMNTISIGNYSNIQDGSVIHITHDGPYSPGGAKTCIGNYVTIGHNATIHGCIIEDYSLIGIGAIILDNAVVESNVVVAAGSLVPPGKILTGGFLWMGAPVKAVRKLNQAELDFFAYSAQNYVSLKNDYRKI